MLLRKRQKLSFVDTIQVGMLAFKFQQLLPQVKPWVVRHITPEERKMGSVVYV